MPPPRDELLRRIAGCDGVLTLLTDKVDDEFLDAAGPRLRVVSNYRRRLRQHRRRGLCRARCRGRQHAGRPDRDHRRSRLGAADGRRPAPARGRPLRPGRELEDWGPLLLLGPDVHGATIGIVGFGRIGQAVARRAMDFGMRILYHDVTEAARGRSRTAGVAVPAARGPARGERLRVAPRQPEPGDATPHQRQLAGLDEADGRAGQHVPWSRRRPGRPGRGAARRGIAAAALDVTDPEPIHGRPVGRDGQLPDRAAHRVRVAGDDARRWPRWPPDAVAGAAHASPCPSGAAAPASDDGRRSPTITEEERDADSGRRPSAEAGRQHRHPDGPAVRRHGRTGVQAGRRSGEITC